MIITAIKQEILPFCERGQTWVGILNSDRLDTEKQNNFWLISFSISIYEQKYKVLIKDSFRSKYMCVYLYTHLKYKSVILFTDINFCLTGIDRFMSCDYYYFPAQHELNACGMWEKHCVVLAFVKLVSKCWLLKILERKLWPLWLAMLRTTQHHYLSQKCESSKGEDKLLWSFLIICRSQCDFETFISIFFNR